MKNHDLVIGLPSLKSDLPLYEGCVFGKQPKNFYPIDSATRATVPLTLIDTDLYGPMSTPSLGGALYFLLFIDDFSGYTSIYFLSKKSTVLSHFQDYNSLVKNHFDNQKILILHCDNGDKYIFQAFNRFCKDHGIQ